MNSKLVWASLLVAVVGLSPATASARNSYHERWHDVNSGPVDWCPFDDDLFTWSVDVTGNLTVVVQGDGIAYFTESARGTVRWTNNANGKSYSSQFATGTRDLKIVDNGDGTITITTQSAGSDRYRDGDGKPVLSDNGMVRWAVVIDFAGTLDNPLDDEFVADLGIVKPSTGTNDTQGRDLCDDMVAFTS